jgi:hypothetical protein
MLKWKMMKKRIYFTNIAAIEVFSVGLSNKFSSRASEFVFDAAGLV